MFSLQQLFSKDDKFLNLLENAAQEAQDSVRLAVEIVKTHGASKQLDELAIARRREKKIAEQISNELIKTFVTGLEREDIEVLARGLYKIPKTAGKVAERYLIGLPHLNGIDLSRQADLMIMATDGMLAIVRQLRHLNELEKTKELNDRLQYVENEADKLLMELIPDLYNGKYDPLTAIVIRDIYELIEKVVDRCRDVGYVVLQIVLKNS
jgi:uncharacterized protein Yka (UPF0111/DUF47 family)